MPGRCSFTEGTAFVVLGIIKYFNKKAGGQAAHTAATV